MNDVNRPLRIAHVSGESGFSGGEVQVFLLMEGLRARGHHGVLVCPPGSRAAAHAAEHDFEAAAIAMRHDFSPGAILAAHSRLRVVEPDLVHLHTGRANWIGGLAARALGLPAITTRRMDRRVRRGARSRFLYGGLVRRAVAISPAVGKRLIEGGVDEARVRVISSAVDPAALRPHAGREATRTALGAPADAIVLLAPAALVPRKGLDVALEALARLEGRGRRLLLWIAGEGEARGALEAQSRRLSLEARVRFLGRREDVGDLLAGCDLVVLPSRAEGLGVAALEAMAAGRAVVASDVGGLGETVVHERTGLLVPPDDPEALAAALARLADDPELRGRLGRAGPARVGEGFLAEQMVTAYEALYREVLAEASRS